MDYPYPIPAPLPPPFPVGTKLRYIGTREVYLQRLVDGAYVKYPIIAPGLEVEIVRVKPGKQGTGKLLFEEDGYEYFDTTKHGFSVYEIKIPNDKPAGRLIYAEDVGEWEIIK